MSAELIDRWQFGIITVYHFLFVPLTIGLAPLIAGLQTAYNRTGKLQYLRGAKFFGKLFLINFAIGVVTGIVQEFQFGMNWSEYSRFVGDIFGAPLAMEALLAFFLESTFLGLWIFGWGRLSPRLHNAAIWLVSIGTMLSAYFILAANSWMQNPVGLRIDENGTPRLTSIAKVLTNPVQLVTFPHVITAALMTGGTVMAGVSAWYLARGRFVDVFRPTLKLGAWAVLVGGLGTAISGDLQARVMTATQPMKMAAAEALYNTRSGAGFSVFTIGSLDGSKELFSIRVPNLLSFMATGSFNGEVEGINDLQRDYLAKWGAGDYSPNIPVTYWSFRLMIGFGVLAALWAAWALWSTRRGAVPTGRWLVRGAVLAIACPFLANSFGWIFTEMGRQPWAVFGLLKVQDSISTSVSAGEALTGLITLTLLYGALAVVDVKLMVKYARIGPPSPEETLAALEPKPLLPGMDDEDDDFDDDDEDANRPMSFAY
ncbi:cytochrome ubiquinol oxidase subunit I [Cumulibacter manganitolerans]|uniref:cytochrome ubiquinol oxidase subunit I n=1 Tax=Cumulibacter manganitolerans TaxID=1884992 RepID=UPI001297A9EA|nr:cytochrome ubiquinol oxidase subunit I [Cumulibacter manganitolerans]